MNSFAILIPSYKPEPTLIDLVQELQKRLPDILIIIVRDGVFDGQEGIIRQLESLKNTKVITHAVNLGKGRALKTGMNEILAHHPEVQGVVTADADGQHLPSDIEKVLKKTISTQSLVLGSRFKEVRDIPFRSRFGNTLTRWVFRVLIGMNLKDTQTGLRGFPRKYLPQMLVVAGEKYEYETNILISSKQNHWKIDEVDIETVYINQNRGSHFNPILDSMRIYFLLIRFFISSITTSLIDFVVFSVFSMAGAAISTSMIASRLAATLFNFNVNKKVVFKSSDKVWLTAMKYWSLVAFMSFLSYLGIQFLVSKGVNVYASKVIVEVSLFGFSFIAQRDLVFNK